MKSIGLEESGNVSGGIQNIHDGLLAGDPGNDDKNVLIAGTDIEGMPISGEINVMVKREYAPSGAAGNKYAGMLAFEPDPNFHTS